MRGGRSSNLSLEQRGVSRVDQCVDEKVLHLHVNNNVEPPQSKSSHVNGIAPVQAVVCGEESASCGNHHGDQEVVHLSHEKPDQSQEGKTNALFGGNSIMCTESGSAFEDLGDLATSVKHLVVLEPRITLTSLRQKLKSRNINATPEYLTKVLFEMAENGLVVLEKIGGKSISVSPSMKTLREAKAREGPELSVPSSNCRKIQSQQLPGHLKEGSTISIVVTEVRSPSRFWFNLHQFSSTPVYFDAVQVLMDEMDKFYAEEGKSWKVESVLKCQPGTVLAAQYGEGKEKEGFHRVIVKKMIGPKRLELFYVDHGSTSQQKLKHVRFLPSAFGHIPAQAMEGQLWGVEQVGEGSRWPPEATKKFLTLVKGAEEGSLVAKIMDGVTRRRSKVDQNSNLHQIRNGLALRLDRVDLGPRGTNIAKALVAEDLAMWDEDLNSDASPSTRGSAATCSSVTSTAPARHLPGDGDQALKELKQREESVIARLDKLCLGLNLRKIES